MSTTQLAAAPRPESHAVHWVAMAMTPQLGPGRARKLAERFGGVANAMHASLTALEGAGLHAASAQAIFNGHSLAAAEEELVRAAASGAQVVDFDDPQYPPLLKQIYDPPLALYVRGDAAILAHPGIAVVGTRLPTPYGLGMAERLSCDLAVRGLIIISGLARGVDAAAHRGAANTMRGVQARRPSFYDLEDGLKQMHVPTLVVVGDEDDHCLQPGIFLKKTIPACGLSVFPKTGHTLNLEEPTAFNALLAEFFAQVEAGHWLQRDPRAQPGQIMRTS